MREGKLSFVVVVVGLARPVFRSQETDDTSKKKEFQQIYSIFSQRIHSLFPLYISTHRRHSSVRVVPLKVKGRHVLDAAKFPYGYSLGDLSLRNESRSLTPRIKRIFIFSRPVEKISKRIFSLSQSI